MKKFKHFFGLSTLVLLACVVLITLNGSNTCKKYKPRVATTSQITRGIQGAIEYMAKIQGDFFTGKINMADVILARTIADNNVKYKTGNANDLDWKELGPDNVGGRVRAILFDNRDATHSTMYVGGVGGGLWKSLNAGETWFQVAAVNQNLAISSIAQGSDGTIFVGTGEGLAGATGTNQNTGQIGSGIYSCTSGDNFQLLASTAPAVNNDNDAKAQVNRLACNPKNGYVYASCGSSLRFSSDNGLTWRNAKQKISAGVFLELQGRSPDVKIANDGTILAVVANKCYLSQDSIFTEVTPKENGTYITGIGRIEVAIAPSNTNYLYAVVANGGGALKNIYRSADKGATWTIIAPGGSSTFPLFGSNNQGWYDNVIAVFPNNPKKFIVGGTDMWLGEEFTPGAYYGFTQITNQSAPVNDLSYAHADHHVYVFHPTNPNVFYCGTDGGIQKSADGGMTFHTLNRNLNITQFYGLAIGHDGSVLGGTQDNSNPYIDRGVVSPYPQKAQILWGGDGGWAAMSQLTTIYPLREKILFVTSQNAGVGRTYDNGTSWEGKTDFFNGTMNNSGASFVTPMLMWQTVNNTLIKDSVTFTALDSNFLVGETVQIKSKQINYPFNYTLTAPLDSGKSIKVLDKIQSHYFIGLTDGIWMTDQPLNFTKKPRWFQLSQSSGTCMNMAYSNDGDCLFAGVTSGFGSKLIRIKNINAGYDSVTWNINLPTCVLDTMPIKYFSGRTITSIAVDPKNANNIIVTLGNYGNSDYVYASNNALSANPTFTNVTGNGLPNAPVYSALVEMNYNNVVLLGTEFGVYSTTSFNFASLSGAVTWGADNKNMNRVPVFQIRQQTMNFPQQTTVTFDNGAPLSIIFPGTKNYGDIYISTHGRGFWEAQNFHGGSNDIPAIAAKPKTNLDVNVFPNPVMSGNNTNVKINTNSKENVTINVYDIKGTIVKSMNLGKITTANYIATIDCRGLNRGTYFVQVISGTQKASSKIIVM